MITEVELVDFLSHGNTKVAFGPGMNVIVGPNGAGKSSIVDGVTFALFGKHMRRVNKSLIRHGATSAHARVVFDVNGHMHEATRKLKAGGISTPTLREWSEGKWVNLAAGERKQMGESTTGEIESIIKMNFERMQIASIIRQGELADIVHESPKSFKMRINDIIGNNDLDEAEKNMGSLIAGFRDSIRKGLGHDDTHLGSVTATLDSNRAEAQSANDEMRSLAAERAEAQSTIGSLEAELARAEEAERARGEVESRRAELEAYAAQKGEEASAEARKIAAEAAECRASLDEYEAGGGKEAGSAEALKERIAGLESELARAEEAERARGEVESRRAELEAYAAQKGEEATAEAHKIAAEAAECKRHLEIASMAGELHDRLKEAQDDNAAEEEALREGEKTIAKLNEQLDIAGKLSLKDGKCPVCDSNVSSLKPLYREEHIREEMRGISGKNEAHRNAIETLNARIVEAAELERRAMDAKSALEALGVKDADGIEAMERRAEGQQGVIEMAARCADGDWQTAGGIDAQARAHCEAIAELEAKAKAHGGRRAEEIEAEVGRVRRAIVAAAILETHSVGGAADIEAMERRAEGQQGVIEMAARCADGDWQAAAEIDAQARAHCEAIAELESKAGDGGQDATGARTRLEEARVVLDGVNRRHGAAEQRAKRLGEEIAEGETLEKELETVSEYVKRLESIRNVFRRDGPVATSMRSWALNEISRGSTEHLGLLDTRINRITLSEKDRDVTITCHSGVATSEVDSLSGGEQICVALALRLGMARLLGSSGPSYVILDEPTAHLDEERRKALAHVLTSLAGGSEGSTPMQFIMITHDAEIFGEAPVERCYRFEPGSNGTVVSELTHGD